MQVKSTDCDKQYKKVQLSENKTLNSATYKRSMKLKALKLTSSTWQNSHLFQERQLKKQYLQQYLSTLNTPSSSQHQPNSTYNIIISRLNNFSFSHKTITCSSKDESKYQIAKASSSIYNSGGGCLRLSGDNYGENQIRNLLNESLALLSQKVDYILIKQDEDQHESFQKWVMSIKPFHIKRLCYLSYILPQKNKDTKISQLWLHKDYLQNNPQTWNNLQGSIIKVITSKISFLKSQISHPSQLEQFHTNQPQTQQSQAEFYPYLIQYYKKWKNKCYLDRYYNYGTVILVKNNISSSYYQKYTYMFVVAIKFKKNILKTKFMKIFERALMKRTEKLFHICPPRENKYQETSNMSVLCISSQCRDFEKLLRQIINTEIIRQIKDYSNVQRCTNSIKLEYPSCEKQSQTQAIQILKNWGFKLKQSKISTINKKESISTTQIYKIQQTNYVSAILAYIMLKSIKVKGRVSFCRSQ